jgi:regulatory protein
MRPIGRKRVSGEAAADQGSARSAAVALLARRDFARAELGAKLATRGYQPDVVGAVLEELSAAGYLDDARYASHYVAAHAARGQGPSRIAAELKSLGVQAELIDVALAAGEDWPALARSVRARRFGPQAPVDYAEKARQARFLQYRGFSADHIRSALADFDPDE